MFSRKKNNNVELAEKQNNNDVYLKNFFDMNLPGNVQIFTDYIQQDDFYRCILAIRSYPSTTTDQALLARLGEKSGVTLHIYTKELTQAEEGRIIRDADKRFKSVINTSNDAQQNMNAQVDAQEVMVMIAQLHKNKESLVHTTVFIELCAQSLEKLEELKNEVASELKYLKISVDELNLRQEQGFLSVIPGGSDQFNGEFSRAIPERSVANLYPMSYSGKTDPHGFQLGKDKNGSYIITDINKKDNTHTNANGLILGNSGQGKSYLLKGMIINLLESGKNVIILDPEHEYEDLVKQMGGNYLDLMTGKYMINVLEPKTFTTVDDEVTTNDDSEKTDTFKTKGALAQHLSFLRDFFRTYKNMSSAQLDILGIILQNLYESKGITNETDLKAIPKNQFPTMSDLWSFTYNIYVNYTEAKYMFSKDRLRDVLLALESICKGAQAQFFDGHTNIEDNSKLIAFGMQGALEADESLRNTMLFNTLSYMSDKLLNQRNTVAILDEFYLFLSSQVSVEYVRNAMKRVRKRDSAVILASQNIEDFLNPEIATFTKPLFIIPTHKWLFHPGNIDAEVFTRLLQLTPSEYRVIQYPHRGLCLYCCGPERYSLQVEFPTFKTRLFGSAGGN